MHHAFRFAATTALVVGVAIAGALPASAACTRLAFSVNDYGKDGPTKDAKELLDKYIAQWAAERGIKSYRTGTKSVTCELFLDFVVFDEHTCKAEATVCWTDGPAAPKSSAAPLSAPKANASNPPLPPATAPEAVPSAPEKPPQLPKAKAAAVAH